MTCFYGFPERTNIKKSLDLIRELCSVSDMPWVIIGDFNDLLSQNEKRGGSLHPCWLSRGFAKTIEDYGLVELDFHGYPFTWERRYENSDVVEEKLDRAFASHSSCQQYPEARVDNLVAAGSDHVLYFLGLSKWFIGLLTRNLSLRIVGLENLAVLRLCVQLGLLVVMFQFRIKSRHV